MDLEKAEYIIRYFSKLMTTEEAAAIKHWSVKYKIDHSNSTEKDKEFRTKAFTDRGWLSVKQEVLNLLEDGIEAFKINTAIRISQDHPDVLILNNCPKCGKLARTPFAKQCPHCFHSWH